MRTAQVLILDGDDTLWENNVYFEQSIEDFIDFVDHSRLTREQVRAALDEVEGLNAGVHGYGSAALARNLRETYEHLTERDVEPAALDYLMRLARRITEATVERLPGIAQKPDYRQQRPR